MTMKRFIEMCLNGQDLTPDEASGALELIMTGQATDSQTAGLLVALRAKGETVNEIVGFARTMRQRAIRINVEDENAIDLCGTGGDGLSTFNISTIAAFVAAGAGVTVAKHGNRSVSSRSGSADVLTALGMNIQLSPARTEECINKIGVGFLFAPLYHPAMKFAAKPRAELGVRTIFNMVGPLTNPAGVQRQLVGTYHEKVAANLAGALEQLEASKACVVHSGDGMDEVTISGETRVLEVTRDNVMQAYSVSPGLFGLDTRPLSSIRGGDEKENAAIARKVLNGETGAARDVVLANAAFGIYVSGKALDIRHATEMATDSLDSGRARTKLQKLLEYSGTA